MTTMDWICIQALEVRTVIGVHPWEQKAPRLLALNVEVGLDIREAAASDHVRDAIDYQKVAERIADFSRDQRHALLETYAERLSKYLFDCFPMLALRLEIKKPGAIKDVSWVGLRMERRREDYAVCGR